MRVLGFLVIFFVNTTLVHANHCVSFLSPSSPDTESKKPALIEVTDTESFFEAMTQGLILNKNQSSLFEFYRTRFGDPKISVDNQTLVSVLQILAKHPELDKPLFREQILERVAKVYQPTKELKSFIQKQLRSAGQMRSNLFQIDANLGYWKKLIPADNPELFNRILNLIANEKSKEILKQTNSDTSTANSKALFHALRHYRRWLKTQPDSQKYLERVQQAMVDLVHVAGFFNSNLVDHFKTPDAIQQIHAYRKILDAREELAMEIGGGGHLSELQEIFGVLSPTGIDPKLARRDPTTNEDGLTLKLAQFEREALESEFTSKPLEAIRIRSLSIIEAPFRSCLGGSDCSTRTYFSKALDPNFYYFTMTDHQNYSSGHITVVLGTAKDAEGKEVQIAFIDKIQNVPNDVLPIFLEGVRRSLAEQNYKLVMPKEVGNENGLSNIEGTRSFVRTTLISTYIKELSEFVPQPNDYKFDSKYSRAYNGLSVLLVEPQDLQNDVRISPGDLHAPRAAPTELNIDLLLEPILRLGESQQEADLLQYLALSQSVEGISKFGFDVEQYWEQVESIFQNTTSDAIKKQALYALILNRQRDVLLVETNFTPELWQQLLGEVPNWASSSNQSRKMAWERLSSFDFSFLKLPIDVVKLYLKSPFININSKINSSGNSVLFSAITSKASIDVINLLLNTPGIDVNLKNNAGETVLIAASEAGNVEAVELLLKTPGIDINLKRNEGTTALMLAAKNGHLNVVRLLLNAPEININESYDYGKTALTLAYVSGHKNVVDFLISFPGVDISPALNYIVEKEDVAIFKKILALPNFKKATLGPLAVVMAMYNDRHDIFEVLLQNPEIDINSSVWYLREDNSPLHSATGMQKLEFLKMLLNNSRLNVNLAPAHGIYRPTALHKAAEIGNQEIIKLLFKHNDIDLNAKDKLGKRPIHYARELEVVRLFTANHGVDINARDSNGWTMLHLAIAFDSTEIVKFLLQQGNLDLNIRDCNNDTPLHLAIRRGKLEIAKLLIGDQRVLVGLKGSFGMTALEMARQQNHQDLVDKLIGRGAEE